MRLQKLILNFDSIEMPTENELNDLVECNEVVTVEYAEIVNENTVEIFPWEMYVEDFDENFKTEMKCHFECISVNAVI